ncbi:hypothetical protein KSP40_PGU004920 [Platanthera guangdongensis]|uniref:Uncharacterized protein n=1 Tax=Platanthera guangdongensis TaxID=2320717 RepID=A0ABR2M9R5_9ASPA
MSNSAKRKTRHEFREMGKMEWDPVSLYKASEFPSLYLSGDHNRAATFSPGTRILLARDFAMDASTFISLSVRSPTFYHRPPPLRGGRGLLCCGFNPRRRQTSLFANPSSPHLFLRTHVRCFSRSPEKYVNADSVGVEPPHTGTLIGSRGEVSSLLTPEEELTVSKTVRYRNRFLNFLRLGSVVDNMADSFFKSEIRRRLFATALLIVISRVGYFIPLPGFDRRLMPQDNLSFASGSTDELGDFSAELKLSLFQLGISPQIAASILMQTESRSPVKRSEIAINQLLTRGGLANREQRKGGRQQCQTPYLPALANTTYRGQCYCTKIYYRLVQESALETKRQPRDETFNRTYNRLPDRLRAFIATLNAQLPETHEEFGGERREKKPHGASGRLHESLERSHARPCWGDRAVSWTVPTNLAECPPGTILTGTESTRCGRKIWINVIFALF